MSEELYTAAEARRIDMERGGKGKVAYICPIDLFGLGIDKIIQNMQSHIKTHGMDKVYGIFLSEEDLIWRRVENNEPYISDVVLHVSWLPFTSFVPKPEKEEYSQQARQGGKTQAMIEQLEKEIESLKANQKAPWRKCKVERPETKQMITYKGPGCSGYYDPNEDEWYIYINGGTVQLNLDFAEKTLSWKYVEEL
jgi:hypothetical protein